MNFDRRRFLKSSGLGVLAFNVGGTSMLLSPREARTEELPFEVLSDGEVETLEAFGDVLLPGAREAGIAHFVDHQLAAAHPDCLLMIRYLDVPPPYADVYRAGLAALNAASTAAHERPFVKLAADDARSLVALMGRENPHGWQGPTGADVLFRRARRRGRRRLRYSGRLRKTRCPVHATHHAD